MINERTKAFGVLAIAALFVALVGLIATGVVDADRLQAAVAAVLAIATTLLAWWRNNNVTVEAQEAQKLLDALKSKGSDGESEE